MRLTIIESPFRGADRGRNRSYLNRCIRHSALLGELPIASHKLYDGPFDEDIEFERKLGIELGYEFWHYAYAVAFYVDLGWSPGMLAAKERAKQHAHLRKYIRTILS